MNIADIRLTEAKKLEIADRYMSHALPDAAVDEAANAATDKAIRKFTDELSEFVEMLKSAPEMHGDIQSDIPKTYAFVNYYIALRNLIGEK